MDDVPIFLLTALTVSGKFERQEYMNENHQRFDPYIQ